MYVQKNCPTAEPKQGFFFLTKWERFFIRSPCGQTAGGHSRGCLCFCKSLKLTDERRGAALTSISERASGTMNTYVRTRVLPMRRRRRRKSCSRSGITTLWEGLCLYRPPPPPLTFHAQQRPPSCTGRPQGFTSGGSYAPGRNDNRDVTAAKSDYLRRRARCGGSEGTPRKPRPLTQRRHCCRQAAPKGSLEVLKTRRGQTTRPTSEWR